MKVQTIALALLLLSVPTVRCFLNTYTNGKTYAVGTTNVKVSSIVDPTTAASTRVLLEISGAAFANGLPAANCVLFGLPSSASSGTNFAGADVFFLGFTNSAGTLAVAPGAAVGDFMCKNPNPTPNNDACVLADDDPNGDQSSGSSTLADWLAYDSTNKVLKIEITRTTAAKDANFDIAWELNPPKYVFWYNAAACPTAVSNLYNFPLSATVKGLIDPSAPTNTNKFSNLLTVSCAFILALLALL